MTKVVTNKLKRPNACDADSNERCDKEEGKKHRRVRTLTPPLGMRCIAQRVKRAAVYVDSKTVGSIGPGLCVLIGIGVTATPDQGLWMATKLSRLRAFANDKGQSWAASVMDTNGSLLLVSQFTLLHRPLTGGNKPDFHDAMPPETAQLFFDAVVAACRDILGPERVQTGSFGAMMDVEILNDGPVTFTIDAPDSAPKAKPAQLELFALFIAASHKVARKQGFPSISSLDLTRSGEQVLAIPESAPVEPQLSPPKEAAGDEGRGY